MGERSRVIVIGVGFLVVSLAIWMVLNRLTGSEERGEPNKAATSALSTTAAEEAEETASATRAIGGGPVGDGGPSGGVTHVGKRVARVKEEDEKGTASLLVRLVGVNGEAPVGANVCCERVTWTLSDDPGPGANRVDAVTGADGTYLFTELNAGDYAVRGWYAAGGQTASVSLREGLRGEVTLECWPGAPMAGKVVDGAGQPIEGAVIHVYETPLFPGWKLDTARSNSARVYSDAAGRFEFPNLWSEKWRFWARAEGFAPTITDWWPAGAQDIVIVLTRGGALSGTVVEQGSRVPLAGVGVFLRGGFSRDSYRGMSDDKGNFLFAGLRATSYTVEADDPELVTAGSPVLVAVSNEAETKNVVLEVAPGGVVTGRVYDPDTGRGHSGATVRGYYGKGDGAPQETTSGADGRYTMRGVPAGSTTFRVRDIPGISGMRPGSAIQTAEVRLGATVEGVDFVIPSGLSISGAVLDGDGNPAPGAYVFAQASPSDIQTNQQLTRDGAFRLNGFATGDTVTLFAGAIGSSSQTSKTIVLENRSVTGVALTLEGGGSIEGIVVDRYGVPIVGARVMLDGPSDGSAATAAGGAFEFQGLRAGSYAFRLGPKAQDTAYSQALGASNEAVATVELAENQDLTGVRLVYESYARLTIRGTVRDDHGQPLAGATITGDANGVTTSAISDASGAYVLANVLDDVYRLSATLKNYAMKEWPGVVRGGEDDARFVMAQLATVEGRVVDGATGEAISVFYVRAIGGMANGGRAGAEEDRFGDPNGRYVLEGVPTGKAILHARAEGYAPGLRELDDIDSGERITGVEIRLMPGATVEGVVFTPSGAPLAGAEVYGGTVRPDGRISREIGGARSAIDGAFRLTGVPESVTWVTASYDAYADGAAAVTLVSGSTTRAQIVMREGGVVEGVVRLNGAPHPNAYVNAYGQTSPSTRRSLQTGNDGAYRIEGLNEGAFVLDARIEVDGSGRNLQRPVDVVAGATLSADFDFYSGTGSIEGVITVGGEIPTLAYITVYYPGDDGNTVSINSPSAQDGAYRFEQLPAGEISLDVSLQGGVRQITRRNVTLGEGEALRLDIEMLAGVRVVGRVEGMGDAHAAIAFLLPEGTGEESFAISDMGGLQQLHMASVTTPGVMEGTDTFLIEGAAPGRYVIGVIALRVDDEDQPRFENLRTGMEPVIVEDGEAVVSVVVRVR